MKWLERRRLRKLLGNLVRTAIIVHGTPQVDVHESIIVDKETIYNLMSKHFSGMAHDPRLLHRVKNILSERTDAFIEDLVDFLIKENRIKYRGDCCCSKCNSSLYQLGAEYFCLKCYKEKLNDKEDMPLLPEESGE
jgi:hypothetical protein